MVFLNARNLRTYCLSRKLDFKNYGPFPIVKQISPYAYRLNLPNTIQVHPVFYTSLLSSAGTNPHPGYLQLTIPPVIVNGEEEFQIE